MSNRSRPTNSIDKIVPEFLDIVTNGGNGTETCYYNSFYLLVLKSDGLILLSVLFDVRFGVA